MYKIKYEVFLFFLSLHLLASVSFILKDIKINTILIQMLWYLFGTLGITTGYHRYWCHNTFKAYRFLEYILLFMGTTATQGSVIYWTQTHRCHHRNEDKNGDPYDITKGFWFAHFGWFMTQPDMFTQTEINKTNVKDLNDPILVIQDKYYFQLWIVCSLMPVYICSFWGDAYNGFFTSFLRIVLVLHATWFVNSLAHYCGEKPFNKELAARENLFVSIFSMGEGWHNYHHSFPKDYRASEYNRYNPTTWFIDAMCFLGLAYDRHVRDKNKSVGNFDKFDKNNYNVISR